MSGIQAGSLADYKKDKKVIVKLRNGIQIVGYGSANIDKAAIKVHLNNYATKMIPWSEAEYAIEIDINAHKKRGAGGSDSSPLGSEDKIGEMVRRFLAEGVQVTGSSMAGEIEDISRKGYAKIA